jgi:predicted permease
MGLHGMALAVLVVICAMPAMVYSIVLATEFDVFPTFVASAVIVSTVCSMLTLTGLITYLKRYVVGG